MFLTELRPQRRCWPVMEKSEARTGNRWLKFLWGGKENSQEKGAAHSRSLLFHSNNKPCGWSSAPFLTSSPEQTLLSCLFKSNTGEDRWFKKKKTNEKQVLLLDEWVPFRRKAPGMYRGARHTLSHAVAMSRVHGGLAQTAHRPTASALSLQAIPAGRPTYLQALRRGSVGGKIWVRVV